MKMWRITKSYSYDSSTLRHRYQQQEFVFIFHHKKLLIFGTVRLMQTIIDINNIFIIIH